MDWRIAEPTHLLGAMRTALAQGGGFLGEMRSIERGVAAWLGETT